MNEPDLSYQEKVAVWKHADWLRSFGHAHHDEAAHREATRIHGLRQVVAFPKSYTDDELNEAKRQLRRSIKGLIPA